MIELPTEAEPVRVIQGDCLDVLRELPDGCVDAVVTDPPYGLGFDYLSYEDTRANLADLIAGFVPECRRITDRVFITPGQSQVGLYPAPDWMVAVTWNTTGSFGAFGYSQWMPVLVYGRDVAGFGSVNGVLKSDLIQISGGSGVGFMRDGDVKHPCPKPLNVMRLLVRRLTNPDNLILDPFGGSGTTAVACIAENRRCIIIEKEPRYCDIIRRRVDEAMGMGRGSLLKSLPAESLFAGVE
jgi:site-specific DNA-methyltransferase (adenine-specific)